MNKVILDSHAIKLLHTIAANTCKTSERVETLGSNNIDSFARTPNILRVTTAGTIVPQIYDFAVANIGVADGTVLGVIIKPGETLSFDGGAINNYYLANTISYDGTGTELLITYNS